MCHARCSENVRRTRTVQVVQLILSLKEKVLVTIVSKSSEDVLVRAVDTVNQSLYAHNTFQTISFFYSQIEPH